MALSDARIDVLRGIAALGVALFHVRAELWVGWTAIQANPESYTPVDQALSWLGIPLRFLGAGVLLFFVISGYCIHGPQAGGGGRKKLTTEKPEWRRFYVRRFLRIYPPYLAVLVLSGVVLAWSGGMDWNRFLASLSMLQNYWPPRGQISTNHSLWSLPVEMELYLVYPLAWWLGRRLGWAMVLGLAGCVSLVAQGGLVAGAAWLDGSVPRFWALWCAGAWVAERRATVGLPSWNARWMLGLTLTLVAAASSELLAPTRIASQWLWGVVGVLALIWAAGSRPAGTAALEQCNSSWLIPLAWLGTFSYALYLVHYPLFHLAGGVWQGAFGAKPSCILVPLAAVALVIPLAWLFYCLVELPSHRLARRLGARKT